MTRLAYPLTRSAPLCAAVVLALGLFGPANAAEERSGPNADVAAPDTLGPVAVIDAARQLAEFGRAQEDPTILLGAARTLQLIGEREPDGEVVGEGQVSEDVKPAQAQTTEKPDDAGSETTDLVAELLDEARFLARGDETLLARADTIAESASRGSVTGPGVYDVRVESRSYRNIRERFRGGELAEVGLRGDGDTDLDLFVYDGNGSEICRSTTYSDREFCRWTPAWTGNFTIRVENYGGVYNRAEVYVN